MKTETTVPAATIRGTFTTYENSKQQDLNEKLGHCVDFTLENLAMIELGGWGTNLRVRCLNGSVPSIGVNSDGSFTVVIKPAANSKLAEIKDLELQAGIVGALAQASV